MDECFERAFDNMPGMYFDYEEGTTSTVDNGYEMDQFGSVWTVGNRDPLPPAPGGPVPNATALAAGPLGGGGPGCTGIIGGTPGEIIISDPPPWDPPDPPPVHDNPDCGHLFEVTFTINCKRECPIDILHSHLHIQLCPREGCFLEGVFGKCGLDWCFTDKEDKKKHCPFDCWFDCHKDCKRDCSSDCKRECPSDKPNWCIPKDSSNSYEHCPFDCWFDKGKKKKKKK